MNTSRRPEGKLIEMKKSNVILRIFLIIMALIAVMLVGACSARETKIDPGAWGYDCVVTYDALGGTVNQREVRTTYYMKNSYLFSPAGTTNMLIEPVRDGYALAGWYVDKEDVIDADGNVEGYLFKAEDRWDFDEDRVQEDMTLYARWIPRGHVDYIDAETGTVMFSKNLAADSAVQELTSATESLIHKNGYTFLGYFDDEALTIPYDFTQYEFSELIPSKADVYATLAEEFPNLFREVDYVEPEKTEDPEVEDITDTSDLFINKLGYELDADESEREMIRARKDEIYEEAIQKYEKNSGQIVVYLKYIEGNYARVGHREDLFVERKYGFTGRDRYSNEVDGYILTKDIDFSGVVFDMSEEFSGIILGNGHRMKNVTLQLSSKKIDTDTEKSIGMFASLSGATIKDLTFENFLVKLNVNEGIRVNVGALALNAEQVTLQNVAFDGLTITTGKGDNGSARYHISDLFLNQKNVTLQNVTATEVDIQASPHAKIDSYFGFEPEVIVDVEVDESGETGD